MTTWFISDTHFGHTNILFYTPERAELWANADIKNVARQYAKDQDREKLKESISDLKDSLKESVDRMTEGLIQNWNSRIQPDDIVYHNGDFMMGPASRWESVLNRLNGKIHLIKGNHDRKFIKQNYAQNRMEWIKDDYLLKIQDFDAPNGKHQQIVLHHYPKFIWEDGHKGVWHFHGHCHGSIDKHNQESTRIDIGVDSEHGQYFPRSYEELKKAMSKRTYKILDHHGGREDI